jgi:phosphoribosylformylglycinamidine synthase
VLTAAAAAGVLESAHDCSDGGAAVTLAECAFDSGGLGLRVDLPAAGSSRATLFGESASRAIVTVRPENRAALMRIALAAGVVALAIGEVGGTGVRIAVNGELAIDAPLAELERIWSTSLARNFGGRERVQ